MTAVQQTPGRRTARAPDDRHCEERSDAAVRHPSQATGWLRFARGDGRPGEPAAFAALRLLLGHDLRLGWRDFRSNFRLLGDRALAVLVAVLFLVMHAAAWSTGSQLAAIGTADAAGRARVVLDLSPGMTFILLLMLAQSLSGLTKTLYGRGDLDLILGSPFPARIALAVRVMAVGLGAMASAAIFAVPVVDVALLHGAWRSLALLPVLIGAGFWAAGLGLMIVIGLFATLGARRTRLAAQIVATFIGGGFMVWLQVRSYLPSVPLPPALAPATAMLSGLPMRAAAGEPASLATWLASGALLFGAVVAWTAPRFGAIVAAATTIPPALARPSLGTGRDRRFETRLGVVLRAKEWRLLRRDPWLLSQLLLQVLYMTPMLLMLMNGSGPVQGPVIALAPMVVVIGYQVSASMTWLSLSAEDAPELLATAPVTTTALQAGKLKAVGALAALLAAAPLAALAVLAPRAALVTAALAALGITMAMLLSLWHLRPARRSTFAARHRESKLLALMEMVMSMLLGVTTALGVAGSAWAALPLGLCAIVLLVNRPRSRRGGSADREPAVPREPGQQPT